MIGAEALAVAVLVLAVGLGAVALLLPLRGGVGEHAHAGPGALTVPRSRAALDLGGPPDEEIVWPEEEPERTGRHRLHVDDEFCHRLATLLALRAHRDGLPLRAGTARIDIRLHGALG
ncbi:hypothetical protein ACL03H_07550 [Saccharopolyspora sp. MS10]|uniref:hypothetical protein n=1 Tax=Saccharopolyspora sp. MS10 TaxID=3385973 RepID=UPI00399FB86D